MQTILFIWLASSIAIFASAVIVAGAERKQPVAAGRIAFLAAFWPAVITGLLVSFGAWCIAKQVVPTHQGSSG